jgi:sucrose-6F-phosphate phosphohydrolase
MATRLLLCTDLDRTLMPNGPLPESPGARDKFNELVASPDIVLVYVTGRDQHLVEDAVTEYHLPLPAYVIADVGSTIFQIEQGGWQQLETWEQMISPDWMGRTHDDMRLLFSELPHLKLQEASKQNTFKLSYYLPLDIDHQTLMCAMHEILFEKQIKASLIWSVDEVDDIGLLDVLPTSASKRHAIEYLMDQLGFELSNTVFAGDSGNDLAVLTSPIKSILVANARNEVRHCAQQQALNLGQMDALYFARGGFLGMNGNYAAGVLEGMAHYVPEVTEQLELLDET